MKSILQTWTLFAVSLGVVVAVMTWVTVTMLRLDSESRKMRQQAAFEEDIRLALWRMDSAATPIIARENARPIGAYRCFEPVTTEKFRPVDSILGRVPSRLLIASPEFIRLHFTLDPADNLVSPQVPTTDQGWLAATGYVARDKLEAREELLERLAERVGWDDLDRLLAAEVAELGLDVARQPRLEIPDDRLSSERQQALNVAEFEARNMSFRQSPAGIEPTRKGPQPERGQRGSILRPLWLSDQLLLVRRVVSEEGHLVQGCWLDWAELGAELVRGVADLLPHAELRAISADEQAAADGTEGRRLASLPVRLLPGPVPLLSDGGLTPIQVSLGVAWTCLLLAAAAVFALLAGAVSLSEKRGAFVSAVTHELRTPLTSLRIYTEMLADGLVVGEQQRQEYLETMRQQSERLAHLVENVLAYSRLERGRQGGTLESILLSALLDRVTGPLTERCRQAGTSLRITVSEELRASAVRVDLSAVERILMNLVDNAAKYGACGESDKPIVLEARCESSAVLLRVRDFGPGLSREARGRLFRPFSKSAAEAAEEAPGVGLGLALSHRLARRMGGDLSLDRETEGTAFVLRLPHEKLLAVSG